MLKIQEPITFGEDVILFCKPGPRSISKYLQRKFKLGNQLLLFDEQPLNRNKYGGTLEEDGFTLVIKRFQENDFRKIYTCLYGFDRYTVNLSTTNYIWNPEPDTYNVAYNTSLSQLGVYIEFQKIYPVPKCYILFEDKIKNTTMSQNSTSVVGTYFFASSMKLEYQYNWDECGKFNAVAVCNIGNKPKMLETLMISRECLDVCQLHPPCYNNGTCWSTTSEIMCSCIDDFNGDRCENSERPDTTTIFISGTVIDNIWIDYLAYPALILCAFALVAVLYCIMLSRNHSNGNLRTEQNVTSALCDTKALCEQDDGTILNE